MGSLRVSSCNREGSGESEKVHATGRGVGSMRESSCNREGSGSLRISSCNRGGEWGV